MGTVTSRDGTAIAFDQVGRGPALILVDGALCHRGSGPSGPLAEQLADDFTVTTYDRRGRGESGDTQPYAVDREVEDLAALIEGVGGSAFVYGISSGAALALEAANRGVPMEGLALYEAPFVVDDTRAPVLDDYVQQMHALAASDPGGAVRHFLRNGVGLAAPVVLMIRVMPGWSKLTDVAHTLPYDTALTADRQRGEPLPRDRWDAVTAPTLVIAGTRSPAWMRNAMRELADVVPGARHRALDGQTHMVKPAALAPVLVEFFRAVEARRLS